MDHKIQKKKFRSELFRHLDGLVIAPIAMALYNRGILGELLEQGSVEIGALSRKYAANEGYLNVALRAFASQGWLTMIHRQIEDEVIYHANSKFEEFFSLIPLYGEVVHLMKISGEYHHRRFERPPFEVLKRAFLHYRNHFSDIDSLDPSSLKYQVGKHIEGHIVGPSAVHLGMNGMFHKYFMEVSFRPEEFHKDSASFSDLLDIFSSLGWFSQSQGTYRFTDKGLFFAQRASAYGVTVSYMPMLRKVEEMIFEDADCLRPTGHLGPELHVDREMNVWGSGGAHTSYFKQVDDIITTIFNKPIEEQPKGILDMGCGNGAFLIHIFDVIEQRTLRGKILDEYPLFLVGADYNEAALKVTRANLIQADIWAKIIWGDISDPDKLASDLRSDYEIELRDLLNVRTFLDHNRIWSPPQQTYWGQQCQSSGAFAFRGKRLNACEVEANLLEHLSKWSKYIDRHGLLVIELHTIHPELAAAHLGQTAATAYDVTHGLSDQYIVEIDVLHKVAAKASLKLQEPFFHKYPNNDIASVSINLFQSMGS